jgi:hypothetical protein
MRSWYTTATGSREGLCSGRDRRIQKERDRPARIKLYKGNAIPSAENPVSLYNPELATFEPTGL